MEDLTNTAKTPVPLSDTCALVQNHGTEAETKVKGLWAVLCGSGWVVCIICLAFNFCECV